MKKEQSRRRAVSQWPRKSSGQIKAEGGIEEGSTWERRWFQRIDDTLEKNKAFKIGLARGKNKNHPETARKTKKFKRIAIKSLNNQVYDEYNIFLVIKIKTLQ